MRAIFILGFRFPGWLSRTMRGKSSRITSEAAPLDEPWSQVLGAREFPGWIAEHRLSLVFTTYQAGKLILLGLQTRRADGGVRADLSSLMRLWGDGLISELYDVITLLGAIRWRYRRQLPGTLC